jgi:hypothetical protein
MYDASGAGGWTRSARTGTFGPSKAARHQGGSVGAVASDQRLFVAITSCRIADTWRHGEQQGAVSGFVDGFYQKKRFWNMASRVIIAKCAGARMRFIGQQE